MKHCQICGHGSPSLYPTCPRCGEASWSESGPDTVRPTGEELELLVITPEPLAEPPLPMLDPDLVIEPLAEPKKRGRQKKDSS